MSQKNRTQRNGTVPRKADEGFFRPLSWLIIISSMAIAPFTFDAFVIPKILILYVGLFALGTFTLIFRRKVTLFNKVPIWIIAFIIALSVLLVSSTVVSETPLLRAMFGQYGRGNGLFYYFGALAVFLLAALSYADKEENLFTKLMTYLSLVLGIYAIFQSVGIDFAKLDSKGLSPVVLTLGNSNFAGGFLAMLFGFIFTRSFQKKKIEYRDLAISMFLLFGIYLTGAVQGYLIAAFVLLIVGPLRIVTYTKSQIWKLAMYAFWVFVGAISIFGLAGSGPASSIFARPTFQMRIEYWKISIRILRDNLLFGIGPDRLYDITPLYMTPGSLKLVTLTTLDSPHNWFLHFGSSFGLPALLLLLVLILTPIYMFLKNSKVTNFLSNQNSPTFIALLCLVIDGLVSIEQVGLGIWMYFFAGKILAPSLNRHHYEPNLSENNVVKKFSGSFPVVVVTTLIFSLMSSGIILERFRNDALLRSSIQKVMLESQTELDYQRIETLALKLRAEPEYVVQAVPVLAKIGDGPGLLNISKSYFDYNPKSRQALIIRFEVLNVVTSREKSCPLLPGLILSTPWVSKFVENFLLCAGSGFYDGDQISELRLIEKYIEFSFPQASLGENTTSADLPARAVRANLQFQLGNVKAARLFQEQIILELPSYKAIYPSEDLSRITTLLNF